MKEPVTLLSSRFDRSLADPGHRWAGRVEGVYAHAAVLRVEREGLLLTLLHSCRDLVPMGLEIPWEVARPEAGQTFELRERRLSLGDGAIQVELSGPGTSLALEPGTVSAHALEAQLRCLALPRRSCLLLGATTGAGQDGALAPLGVAGSEPLDLATETASRYLTRLAAHLRSPLATAGDFAELTGKLSGLGPGATPTGDDLLAGLAAAGHRLSRSGLIPDGNWRAFLRAVEGLRPGATTPVAEQMLRHAAKGRFPEALLRVVALLGAEGLTAGALKEAVEKLQTVGAQTGCDMLAGAVALMRAALAGGGGIA